MIKGIIFDLDGVLTFTDKYHYKAWKKMADEENIYFDEEINNRLRGISRMDSLEIILEKSRKKYTEEEKIELARRKNDTYVSYLNKMKPSDVSSDSRCALESLKKKGYKLALASSSKNAKKILEKTDISKYFDGIIDGNSITKSKPDPEVFLVGAKSVSLDPSECVVIEDAKAGIKGAHDGGFTAIGIGSDTKDYEYCDYHIDSLSEIEEIIK